MKQQKMGQTLREDIKQGGFFKNLKREFKELESFYLDDERREQLKNMGWFRRTFKSMIWLFKSLFFHLTPVRRILLVIAIILFFSVNAQINGDDVQIQRNSGIVGLLVFLFILMLELKDKLLAKNELKAGRAVQQALMPEEQPQIPGWQIFLYSKPANDVGGDLVDFFTIDNNQADITLGDVAGKGLAAALFMAKLQASIRAIAADYKLIDKLVGKVNEIFCRDGMPNRFTSLIYMRIQKNKSTIRLVNAGHHPPFWVKSNTIKELPKGAPAIGLKKDTEYIESTINLNHGEILFVYSDGLTEARNESDTFFGDTRLTKLLKKVKHDSASQIAQAILQSVDNFVSDIPYSDDLSFAILKRMDN